MESPPLELATSSMTHDAAGARPEGDDALVARMATGDQRALSTLWDRHGATAYALACTVTSVPSVAEGVVADSFAQLWREAPSFDPHRMSVFAWLTSIVRQRALAARARDIEVPRVLVHEGRGGGESALSTALTAGTRTLDGLQARAVELAFFGGMSKRQIANELQLSERVVAQLLRGAVETLGGALGRDPVRATPTSVARPSLAGPSR